jgi:uncharacterized membrane protein YesL
MEPEVPNNSEFFEAIDQISSFAIISLLWVAISMFIVTLPAATAGLFAVCSDWVQGKQSETFARFFGAMRHHAVRATQLVLADILIVGLVRLNTTILPETGLPDIVLGQFIAITLSVGLLTLMANIYLWPLLVSYDIPLRELARIALSLVFRHIRWSIWLLVINALALVSGLLLLPQGLIVLGLSAGCALLISWGSWHILQQYDSELQSFEQ